MTQSTWWLCLSALLLSLSLTSCSSGPRTVFSEGLNGSYYDGYYDDDLSFFDQNTPIFQRVDTTINFTDARESWDLDGIPELEDLETFSATWEGIIVVSQTAEYRLYLNSDDASYLFLDEATDNPVIADATINNGATHAELELTADISLAAGDHPILVVFGEANGNNVVQLSWSSDELGLRKEIMTNLGRRVKK